MIKVLDTLFEHVNDKAHPVKEVRIPDFCLFLRKLQTSMPKCELSMSKPSSYELSPKKATFASESGFDSHVMVPEILRFYLNQYTFDMIPSKVKVGRMLQSGCWCQLLQSKEGRGKPRNQFDSFCQQWQKCKQCLGRDCNNVTNFTYKVRLDLTQTKNTQEKR